jgi:hypothetical protein
VSGHAFTLEAPSFLRAIKTEAFVSRAFNPGTVSANLHPPAVQFEAIWDTRATDSVISQKVVDACGLKPIGMARVQTAGGITNCEVYLINLTLPNHVCFHTIQVTLADMGSEINLLIGMNIITRGDFAITNFSGRTCFSFRVPSMERIDFMER